VPRGRCELLKSSPYYAAFLRAVMVGLFSGLSAFLASWSTTDNAKTIAIAAATAFLAPFAARFGVEGTYDTNRDAKITKGLAQFNTSDAGFSAVTATSQPTSTVP
jgi:hypothetical protein